MIGNLILMLAVFDHADVRQQERRWVLPVSLLVEVATVGAAWLLRGRIHRVDSDRKPKQGLAAVGALGGTMLARLTGGSIADPLLLGLATGFMLGIFATSPKLRTPA